jgi:hypothetical protein
MLAWLALQKFLRVLVIGTLAIDLAFVFLGLKPYYLVYEDLSRIQNAFLKAVARASSFLIFNCIKLLNKQ